MASWYGVDWRHRRPITLTDTSATEPLTSYQVYVSLSSAYAYTATSVPRSAGWHRLGFILKADGGVAFYVDGQNVGTLTGQFTDADRVA